jgi:predicted secreted protein
MTTSSAFHAFGTLLKIGDGGSPETFTTIAEVTTLSMPKLSHETIEVTNHSSTEGWREFIPGLKDGGEFTATINYLPTDNTHNNTSGLLYHLSATNSRSNYQIVMANALASVWAFAALVTAFEADPPLDAQMSATVTFKVTGKPTLV